MSWDDAARNALVWSYHMTPALLALTPGLVATFWARSRLSFALERASAPAPPPGMTGERIAVDLLRAAGVEGVTIVPSSGPLATFYDGGRRELRLSTAVVSGRSLALVAIAAHEAGHALQPPWLSVVRTGATFATSFAAIAAWLILASGLLLDYAFMALVGSLIYGASVLARLVTLPLEIDANRRVHRAMTGGDLGDLANAPEFRQALAAMVFSHVAARPPRSIQAAQIGHHGCIQE